MSDEGGSFDEIPTPSLPDGWEEDFLSDAEEQYWDRYDEISEAKKANKLVIHKTFGCILPIAIIMGFLAFAAVLGVYVVHLVIPDDRRWLKPEELQHIHSMIFSGVVGGAIAVFAKTYFLDKKGDDEG
ncbi:MAG: hypothetical protein ACO1NM_06065 [Sphingobium phenoxybenzoativorans]